VADASLFGRVRFRVSAALEVGLDLGVGHTLRGLEGRSGEERALGWTGFFFPMRVVLAVGL
ncbi:MAG: hypothetical protein AAGF12_26565, partial [Myxococcota bacterium]